MLHCLKLVTVSVTVDGLRCQQRDWCDFMQTLCSPVCLDAYTFNSVIVGCANELVTSSITADEGQLQEKPIVDMDDGGIQF